MQLQLDSNSVIIGYADFGEISNGINFDEDKLPDDFYDKFKPSFYLLKDDEIVENPNYVAPEPLVIGPSQQDKINAQIMLNQAKQKAEQDKFNAQILLKLAGGMK